MNVTNTTVASATAVKLGDLVPSLVPRLVLHIIDVCCSMMTFITLSRWRKMRSFSMHLICMMMATEFLAALVLGTLEAWHILNHMTGSSESVFNGRQCYWITGMEGPALLLVQVSALLVSLDRLLSIVAPQVHMKLPLNFKAMAFPTPFVCSTIVVALLASGTVKRASMEVCTTLYLIYDSPIGAVGVVVAHAFMNVSIYCTAIDYAAVLIMIFMKRKSHAVEDISAGQASLEKIKARRYQKMNKVLAYSAICYFLTSSTANTVYLYVEDRQGWTVKVSYFFHGLFAVDGIMTFASFYFFVPSFKARLLGKPDNL